MFLKHLTIHKTILLLSVEKKKNPKQIKTKRKKRNKKNKNKTKPKKKQEQKTKQTTEISGKHFMFSIHFFF